MKKFFPCFLALSFLWTFAPTWANDDCQENAKALLAAEHSLSELFGELSSLTIKREPKWVDVETFVFKYRFLSSRGRKQLHFVVEDDYPFEKMAIWGRNGEEIMNFDYPDFSSLAPRAIDVSVQETHLGTVRLKPMFYGNLADKMFELYSIRERRMIGKIHVPHQNSQILPLLDLHLKKIGKIFHCKKKGSDNFLLQFPKDWQNSEKALFLAAALTIDMDCFFEPL